MTAPLRSFAPITGILPTVPQPAFSFLFACLLGSFPPIYDSSVSTTFQVLTPRLHKLRGFGVAYTKPSCIAYLFSFDNCIALTPFLAVITL